MISVDSSKDALDSYEYDKKKQPDELERLPPIIQRNAKGRKDDIVNILITGFMHNRKRGPPLKITPTTNNKINTKVKATLAATLTKQACPAR